MRMSVKFNIYEFFDYLSSLNVRIRLDAGQPDIPVDSRIKEALIGSLERGETKYVSPSGIVELREKIAETYNVEPDEVIVAPGSKFLIASQVLFSNKVAVIAPYWTAYLQMIEQFGKKCQIIETKFEDRWIPDFNNLDRDVDMIIINYPNNPTGVCIPEGKMRELIDIAGERGIKVISDEVYRDIVFEKRVPSILDYNYDRSVFIHSFSKTFSMTGFRVGFAISNRSEIKKIRRLMEATITCIPKFIQKSAIKALEFLDEIKEKVSRYYYQRLKLFERKIDKSVFSYVKPNGAFYVFTKINSGKSGVEFAYQLAKKGVGVYPGEAFGDYREYLRISLTHPELEKGIEIINELGRESLSW